MRRIATAIVTLVAAMTAFAANPATGQAANADVSVAAVFLDAAAVMQATGSDFSKSYTVIEVTVTPKGGKPLDIQPDDFLLRISSSADSSGPMAASQVLGAGGGLVLQKSQREVIGVTGTNAANVGLVQGRAGASVPAEAINALQSKILPTKTTADPATGLLFFPFAKKKPKDLDLVYTTPDGKLHISFR